MICPGSTLLFFTDAELILNQVQHMIQHDDFVVLQRCLRQAQATWMGTELPPLSSGEGWGGVWEALMEIKIPASAGMTMKGYKQNIDTLPCLWEKSQCSNSK
jgi:hypothetical protein